MYTHKGKNRIVLQKDTQVRGWMLPKGFSSDGCTFPGILQIFKGIMKTEAYHMGCILHDFLRTYALVSVEASDKELKRYIRDDMSDPIRAHIYWLAVKIGRPFSKKPQTLPAKWEAYRNPIER